ncbi:hypothetical protein CHS0354_042104 [Potamilus streckersoni]|uniref:Cysteine protease n=1 Tax=Potamilus streckersoni TaxID=2493646 RepID=A0AAE0TLW5_9BIVA|nr:hypothetical protein CHS0354_042104 [Potamilus streckersoni]
MEYRKAIDKTRRRNPSDEITSLDSWSELSPSENTGGKYNVNVNKVAFSRMPAASDTGKSKEKQNNSIIMDPSELKLTEPRIQRVNLTKSSSSSSDGDKSGEFSPTSSLMLLRTNIPSSSEIAHSHKYQPFNPLYQEYNGYLDNIPENKAQPGCSNLYPDLRRHVSEGDHVQDNGIHRHSGRNRLYPDLSRLGNSAEQDSSNTVGQPNKSTVFQSRTAGGIHHHLHQHHPHHQQYIYQSNQIYGHGRYGNPTRLYHNKQFKNEHKHNHHQDGEFSHNIDGIIQGEKVKNKIMSMWNNVKYGWTIKQKTNFSYDTPIFILGRCYHRRPDEEEPSPGNKLTSPPSMELFRRDFASRIWFTYREGFPSIPGTKLTTDCGWGCMLRSGQMLLAQGLLVHFLGRDWGLHEMKKDEETFYRQIIAWFGDSISNQCPFSVHKMAEVGKKYGKQPGEWYGPSTISYILRDTLMNSCKFQPVLSKLCIYVAQDCTVYKQDIYDLCTKRPRTSTVTSSSSDHEMEKANDADDKVDWDRSVIIIIPVRLGGEEFNHVYTPCIKNLMAQESCLGIIGGKPKHSLYFIGWQEDSLIYLDPHKCQDFVDTLQRDFKTESFHCLTPRKVSLSKMDPSCAVGFYCRNRVEFDKFVENTVGCLKGRTQDHIHYLCFQKEMALRLVT